MHYPQHLIKGALLVVIAELCMATMGALIKQLGESQPNELLVFARNLAGLLVLLPFLIGNKRFSLKTSVLHWHLFRSLVGVSAMYCFFYALINLPLADGMLLKMTAPLFMPIAAYYIVDERVSRFTVWALLVGFAGVLVILRPDGQFNVFVLIGLMGGILAALAKVSIRLLSRTEPAYRIVFYFALIGVLVSMVPLMFHLRSASISLTLLDWLLLVGVGLVGTLGQFALTRGYAIANAGTVAPFTYFSVIFGSVYGYWFWQEIPSLNFMSGALLIAVAGLLTMKKTNPRRVSD